ncbi:MAG: cell wall-binding repeat-containing protein [Candidatus Methanofastidiosia archaeon]
MKRFVVLLLLLVSLAKAQESLDVIIVRGDLRIDYVIAEAYSHKEGIPIVTTDPKFLSESVRKELSGYRDMGFKRALIIGGADTAISTEIENELRRMGFEVLRIWDWDRIGTAARFAMELWKRSDVAILANDEVSEAHLVASRLAIELKAPILLTEENNLPEKATKNALITLKVSRVFLVGPKISDEVKLELEEMGIECKRVGEDIEPQALPISRAFLWDRLLEPYPLAFGIIIGFITALIFRKLYYKTRKGRVPFFVLTEDERRVVNAIGDGSKQEELPRLTGFSRPKITRIVSDLEKKKILSREKYGKTYKLKLLKDFTED